MKKVVTTAALASISIVLIYCISTIFLLSKYIETSDLMMGRYQRYED